MRYPQFENSFIRKLKTRANSKKATINILTFLYKHCIEIAYLLFNNALIRNGVKLNKTTIHNALRTLPTL